LTKLFFLLQINKPIVEKKRRERINVCLDELKDLLLQSASKHEVNNNHLSQFVITFKHLKSSKVDYILCQFLLSKKQPIKLHMRTLL